MDVFETIQTVLAVRSYQDKPVPQDITRKIVEAGWMTGSSMNRQPWHFVVVENRETLRHMGELARTGPYIAQAPLAIAVVIEESRFAVSDASRAIQSMMLAAWAEGVGSNWVGFGGLEALNGLLNIPTGMEILAVVPFGYPAKKLGAGKKNRKPFDDVVHWERFGEPTS